MIRPSRSRSDSPAATNPALEYPGARGPVRRGVGHHALGVGQPPRPLDDRLHRAGRVALAPARVDHGVADLDRARRGEAPADLADDHVVLAAVHEVRAQRRALADAPRHPLGELRRVVRGDAHALGGPPRRDGPGGACAYRTEHDRHRRSVARAGPRPRGRNTPTDQQRFAAPKLHIPPFRQACARARRSVGGRPRAQTMAEFFAGKWRGRVTGRNAGSSQARARHRRRQRQRRLQRRRRHGLRLRGRPGRAAVGRRRWLGLAGQRDHQLVSA